MNIKVNSFFIVIIFTALFFFHFSCKLDENPAEGEFLIRYITNDIDTISFWNKRSIYIIKKTDFKVNKILIIDAGVVVKFAPQTSMTVTDSGYLSCQGTPANPVIFTSLYDSKFGVKANDASYPAPKAGNWNSIYVKSKIPSSFNYCVFSYGGGDISKSTLIIDSVYADIMHCTFRDNKGGTIDESTGALNASKALSKTNIEKCTFYNNELPLSIDCNINLGKENIFQNPEDSLQKNSFNAIAVQSSNAITQNVFWEENKIPYIILGKKLEISGAAYIALYNGVVLKFKEGCSLVLPDGANSLRNQNGRGVVFTSINDDNYMGDTRNDHNNVRAKEDDWSVKILAFDDAFEWEYVFFAKKEK